MRKNVCGIVLLVALMGCGDNTPQKSRHDSKDPYPGPWEESFHSGLTGALIDSEIKECGQYKYRHSSEYSGEYLVWCTSDGKNWREYLVWLPSEKVTGPHQPRNIK